MKQGVSRSLRTIADAAGAKSFKLVRENRHLIVDFHFEGRAPVRQVIAATCSDNRRGLQNQIAQLRKAAKRHH